MDINYVAVIVATILEFFVGFLWYGPIFGKLWGQIHGFDKLSKEVQQKMMATMAPFYAIQLLVTLVQTLVLALFISVLPANWNPYGLAGFFWLGFVLPAQVSAVIFGGTEGKWIVKKIAVQAGAALLCLEVAAAVIHFL